MSLRFELSGRIKQDLAELPEKMLDAALEELNQQADLMVGYAKVWVRVDTGSLRDSIRKERGGKGKHWGTVRVRAGGYIINPKTGKLVNYAVYIEQNYPFMKPAWHQIEPNIESLIERKVVARIER